MDLSTTLTNVPKAQQQETWLGKILSKIGEILLVLIGILVFISCMSSYILLSLITPAGG
jgi:hypothetical protein